MRLFTQQLILNFMNHNFKMLLPFNGLVFFLFIRGVLRLTYPDWTSHVFWDYFLSGWTIFFIVLFAFSNFSEKRKMQERMTSVQRKIWIFLWKAIWASLIVDGIFSFIPPLTSYQEYTIVMYCALIFIWFAYQTVLYWKKRI